MGLGFARSASAQEDRENATPTNYYVWGSTVSSISSVVNQGYRITSLKYRGTNLLGSSMFDATLVRNTGSYARTWWWYVNSSVSSISSRLSTNNARLVELEPYVENGTLKYAAVMIRNTGSHAKSWWWYVNSSVSSISSRINSNNGRLVDVDSYTVNGTTYYSCIMIRNTGSDARSWWWYVNSTVSTISSRINSNNARLYSLDRRSTGRFDCIMIRDPSPKQWHWWVGVPTSQLVSRLENYGERAIDLMSYVVSGTRYYAVLTINNKNALTTDVGNRMRSTTNGTVGCWLERVNGSNLADLNGNAVFEPASTIKVLHHVHAMRQVRFLGINLTTPITVYSGYNGSCPLDTGPFSEQLQASLRRMMENSDNARTQAVARRFGTSAINSTAASLGMSSTSLNHRIGCGSPALANPNELTLRDLHVLYEAVANGYLGSYRNTFYDLMLQNLSGIGISAVIDSEGASLNLSSQTIASFKNFTLAAHKGGSYTLNSAEHRSAFGWVSLPFISNDVIVPREYTFGAFVNDATNGTNANNAIYQQAIPTLLRAEIRAAMQSWTNSLAGSQSFGAGCGSPVYRQDLQNLPRIGTNVSYRARNGNPSTLAVIGFGFSSTIWNGTALPASMRGFGSESGCFAYNDIVVPVAHVSDSIGTATHSLTIPNDPSFVGTEFLSQWYSFGRSAFRTSNSQRTIIGL